MDKTGKIVLSTAGVVLIAIAAALLTASLALLWLYGTQRSTDGFVTSPVTSLTSDGYAITSADIDLRAIPQILIPSDVLGEFKVEAEDTSGSDLFIGIGPLDQVEAFLEDVEHAEYSDVVHFAPWVHVESATHAGHRAPQRPASQDFWTATADGTGLVDLDWVPQRGSWKLVVMNSDPGPGVDVSATVGFYNRWLPAGIVLTGLTGLVAGAAAAAMAVFAFRQPVRPAVEGSKEPELEQVRV